MTRLFTARFRLGMFDPPEQVPYAQIPYSVVDSDAHRALAEQVAGIDGSKNAVALFERLQGRLLNNVPAW